MTELIPDENWIDDLLADSPAEQGPDLKTMEAEVFQVNEANGWHTRDRSFGDDVALLHTEVSEMFEAYRDSGTEDFSGLQFELYTAGTQAYSRTTMTALERWREVQDQLAEGSPSIDWDGFTKDELMALAADGISKPEGVGSEAADILIRLLDTVRRQKIDLSWEYERKIAYNRTRGYRHGNKQV